MMTHTVQTIRHIVAQLVVVHKVHLTGFRRRALLVVLHLLLLLGDWPECAEYIQSHNMYVFCTTVTTVLPSGGGGQRQRRQRAAPRHLVPQLLLLAQDLRLHFGAPAAALVLARLLAQLDHVLEPAVGVRVRPAGRRHLVVLGVRLEAKVLAIRVAGHELLLAVMRDRPDVAPLRGRPTWASKAVWQGTFDRIRIRHVGHGHQTATQLNKSYWPERYLLFGLLNIIDKRFQFLDSG